MTTLRHKSDILFASLPPYFDFLAKLFKKFGYNVFYLSLSYAGQSAEAEKQRALRLHKAGIAPLPLESLPHMEGILNNGVAAKIKLQEKTDQLASLRLLQFLEKIYPDNVDIVSKLRTVVQAMIAGQQFIVDRVNCWAKAYPNHRHWLIYFNIKGFLAFDLVSNARLLVLPISMLFWGVGVATRFFRKFLGRVDRKDNPATTMPLPGLDSHDTLSSRVVFVTHQGVNYGNLFQKTLFYAYQTDSELHPENLLHFDYSNFPSPSEKIKWVCLGNGRQVLFVDLYHVLFAIGRGIFRVRSFSQLVGLILLSRFYATFMFYEKKLTAYPSLKLALIDYEVLCPKALLLAFESRHIKTVAVQERFFQIFHTSLGSVLNTYLCGSDYAAKVIQKSSSYYIDRCFSVGQYKSDNLVKARESSPPQVLRAPLEQGRKIITALGFHTHMNWYDSQPDPLLNWTAHRHFLEDMIRLARDVPNVFIVFRFKSTDWVSLPVFAETIRKIESSENMIISMNYEKSFFSYELCAHSDLVIAKHTSLGDECLAVGIPVLFHEYTHNTERLMADAFDYSPAGIMCFHYRELLERAKTILMGDSTMESNYEHLKNVVFGDLGDGKVRERVHAHINSLLEEHP